MFAALYSFVVAVALRSCHAEMLHSVIGPNGPGAVFLPKRKGLKFQNDSVLPDLIKTDGFITSGNDLMVMDLTPAQSRLKCLNLDGCLGYTFHGSPKTSSRITTYFKSKTEVQGQGQGWTSYVRADAIDSSTAMRLVSVPGCVDQDNRCPFWAVIGECKRNPAYMQEVCRPACRMCGGNHSNFDGVYVALQNNFLGKPHIDHAPHPSRPRMIEVSFDPRVYVVDEFLSHDECDLLMKHAEPHLQVAMTINATTGQTQPDKVRTNQQMYISNEDCVHHPNISKIIHRMHKLARVPYGHAEALQVGRYRANEFYEPHFDSEPSAGVVRSATLIVYLEAPDGGGGETIFPKSAQCNGRFAECCSDLDMMIKDGGGIVVTPEKGKAVLFYTHDLDGRQNPLSLHGSCPVHTGFKWITQQWFRSQPFSASPHFRSG